MFVELRAAADELIFVGLGVGCAAGFTGAPVGDGVGPLTGDFVGEGVEPWTGDFVGERVGSLIGDFVGEGVVVPGQSVSHDLIHSSNDAHHEYPADGMQPFSSLSLPRESEFAVSRER